MDPGGIILNEISCTEKDKYFYAIIYMWNIKSKTNKTNRLTDTEHKLWLPAGKGKGKGHDRDSELGGTNYYVYNG